MPTVTKKVPAKAAQFLAGACEFAASESTDAGRGPIKLTASSGAVFNHWYWGPMVFDVAGMKLAKPRVTLDYCHNQNEVVGYADKIDASGGSLAIEGELVSAKADDRAAEILTKGRAGVPYEASVKFDLYNGLVLEEYSAGAPAQVNGRTELGPLTVVRECLLRGVAVCPYGADPFTQSEFSAGDAAEAELSVTHFSLEENQMSEEKKNEKTATEVKAELIAGQKDYADRFGAELAAKWGPLGEAKPMLDCYAEFVEQLREKHKTELAAKDSAHAGEVGELKTKLEAAEKKATDAETRLNSLNLGEEKPVTGGAASPEVPNELAAALTPAMAKFVTAQRAAKEKSAK